MFTGLIESLGEIAGSATTSSGGEIFVVCPGLSEDLALGDSVAVEGACLTVREKRGEGFVADLSGETLRRTTLRSLRRGRKVNIERALRADGRLGGHFVQGHVDGLAKVVSAKRSGGGWEMTFAYPQALAPLLVEKGSIAVNGISLTVAAVQAGGFSVAVIPLTYNRTTLQFLSPGDEVNLEADILAKYVFRYMETRVRGQGITADLLERHGYGP